MAVRIASMEHHHQEPPPSPRACPPAPTWLPVRRALHERRAMRRASHLAVARRPGMASPSSCSASAINPSLVAELQRESLARRRAFVAAARNFAVTAAAAAEFSKQQQQQQQQQQKQRASLLAASVAIATPPPPAAAAAAAAVAVAPRPSATAVVRESKKVNPEVYFLNLLEKRGRAVTKKMSSQEAGYVKQPTAKQVLDYQSQPFMSDLVRKGDLEGLRAAVAAGRGMDASNKFGESLVHIACRRGHMDVLQFLVANGGNLTCCDDLGRFPLHEVCWAVQPRFDIVRLFLEGKRRPTDAAATATATPIDMDTTTNTDSSNNTNTDSINNNSTDSSNNTDSSSDTNTDNSSSSDSSSDSNSGATSSSSSSFEEGDLNPLLITDKRGCTPLRYVKEESWPMWRQFLDEIVDEYWPSLV